jgi:hypothetical protein
MNEMKGCECKQELAQYLRGERESYEPFYLMGAL